jgi:hypothetical protein
MSTEPFWYDDPTVLFSRATWYVFVPHATMTVKASLNAVVRFSVYLSILLTATTRCWMRRRAAMNECRQVC